MKNKRLYALINIKSVDEDKRIIKLIATTPTPDRVNNEINFKGAKLALPVP